MARLNSGTISRRTVEGPDNPWVITGRGASGRLANLNAQWIVVHKRAGLEDVRIHDLRHGFASRALALGESHDDREIARPPAGADDGSLRPLGARVGEDFGHQSRREHRGRYGEARHRFRRMIGGVRVCPNFCVSGALLTGSLKVAGSNPAPEPKQALENSGVFKGFFVSEFWRYWQADKRLANKRIVNWGQRPWDLRSRDGTRRG